MSDGTMGGFSRRSISEGKKTTSVPACLSAVRKQTCGGEAVWVLVILVLCSGFRGAWRVIVGDKTKERVWEKVKREQCSPMACEELQDGRGSWERILWIGCVSRVSAC
jgi:hypothetical protein